MTGSLTALQDQKFSVGLSFAGEQRAYAQDVALSLREKGVSVFYDRFHEVDLWGCDLVDTLNDLYSERMSLVIVFVSKEYVEKDFTNVERRAALSKAISQRSRYVMPVRFDNTKLPGVPPTLGYLSAEDNTPEQLAVKICKALGIAPLLKANQIPAPQNPSSTGVIQFNPEDHDGRYLIGQDEWQFEICVSGPSDDSIHIYNDPPSISGVAIAVGAKGIQDVLDGAAFNYTSRSRTPREGEVVVLKNVHGFFAALRVVDIRSRSYGDDEDLAVFEYEILRNGGRDFSRGSQHD